METFAFLMELIVFFKASSIY